MKMEEDTTPKARILEPGATFYRPYTGEIKGRLNRTLTILLTDFTFRIKNVWVIVLEVLTWFFGIIPVMFMLYFITASGGLFASGIFIMFYTLIFIWLALLSTVGGARLISDDFANNSLTLYLSRPITSTDYFIGKFGSIFLLISTISLLPSLILAGMVAGFTTGVSEPKFDVMAVVLTFIAMGFLIALVFSSIAMAFSTMTKNHLYAGVGIFCTILFSNILPPIISRLTDNTHVNLISIWYNLTLIADKWSGFNTIKDFDWPLPFGIMLLIIAVCLGFVWYKLSKSELCE